MSTDRHSTYHNDENRSPDHSPPNRSNRPQSSNYNSRPNHNNNKTRSYNNNKQQYRNYQTNTTEYVDLTIDSGYAGSCHNNIRSTQQQPNQSTSHLNDNFRHRDRPSYYSTQHDQTFTNSSYRYNNYNQRPKNSRARLNCFKILSLMFSLKNKNDLIKKTMDFYSLSFCHL